MRVHICGQLLLECTRRPVRRRKGQTHKCLRKDLMDSCEIVLHKSLHLRRHPLDRCLDSNTLDHICPRCKVDLHLRVHRRPYKRLRHRIADKQAVKDRTDNLRLLLRRDRRHRTSLHAFRRNCRNRAFHTGTHNGWNGFVTYDNRRSLLHTGGRCGVCGGRKPPSCKYEKNERPQTQRQADRSHQNVPPTRKCTRPPCEPRP